MKNKLITLLAFCLGIQLTMAQNTVRLSGKLKNFNNQVEIEDMSDFQNLNRPTTDRIIMADASGKFSITFNLASPNYFRIGRNIVYLSPGDDLKLVIDKDNGTKGSFTGSNEEANRYLNNTPYPKMSSFLEAGAKVQPSPKETLATILAAAQNRKEELASLKKISPEFRRLEEARIKADVLNSIAGVASYAKYAKDLDSYPTIYVMNFNNLAAKTKAQYQQNFIDASFMKLVVYRDIVEDLIKNAAESPEVIKIRDWFKATDLIDKMSHENDKDKLTAYETAADHITTPTYNAAVKAYLKGLMQFGKGDLAVDFTAVDINGKKVSLSDLKGKVIYVDIWATWCGPCLAEMPNLEVVKNKYKDNKDVVFVSLSIDDDNQADKWKQNVWGRKAGGYQWQINRSKLSAYNVTTIPRSLLIDKNLKVVSINADLPSSKGLPDAIDKLLGN